MKRLQYLDFLKFFAIFLVLWGHAIQVCKDFDANDNLIYRLIYSFHMALFMMISGYFAGSSLHLNIKDLVVKKGKQLLLPILFWAILASCVGFFFIRGRSFLYELNHLYWFLKSLFICYLMMRLANISHNLQIHRLLLGGAIIISQLIDSYQLPVMFPAFVVGCYLRTHNKYLQSHSLKIILTSFVIWVLYITYSFDLLGSITIPFHFPMQNRIIEIMGKLSGALFFFTLSSYLFRKEYTSNLAKLIAEIGSMTLGIYLLQEFILERGFGYLFNFNNVGFITYSFLITPGIAAIAMLTSVIIIKILRKSKIIAALLLGDNLYYSKK